MMFNKIKNVHVICALLLVVIAICTSLSSNSFEMLKNKPCMTYSATPMNNDVLQCKNARKIVPIAQKKVVNVCQIVVQSNWMVDSYTDLIFH